jgi:putative tryptophan/tyrosine transport system substrate-binding protein
VPSCGRHGSEFSAPTSSRDSPRWSTASSAASTEHGYAASALEFVETKVRRGDAAAVRAAAQQFVAQRAGVVFVIGSEFARLVRQVSAELPIVFITPGDPVAAGLVASLPRPGGNTTAVTFEYPELSAKRLELLQALSPQVRRVLAIYDPADASPRQAIAAARAAAPTLGMTLIEREARSAEEVARGLLALADANALLAIPGRLTSAHYAGIIAAAHARRRPTFFHSRTEGSADALASYGASDADIARDAARLVGKILKGEKAGELPVERPTRLKFVINLKTARALGLDLPAQTLARADEVIE